MAKVTPESNEVTELRQAGQADNAPNEKSTESAVDDSIQHGDTQTQVGEAMKARNKTIIHGVSQSFFGLVTIALDIVGVAIKADEACDKDENLGWGIYFLVHAILMGVMIGLSLLTMWALLSMLNEDVLRAAVLKAKGKDERGDAAFEKGQAEFIQGAAMFAQIMCLVLLLALFGLAWLIVGIVKFANADKKACDDAKSWFWVIFAVNISLSIIGNALKPDMKPFKNK
mmetsp:Transcript_31937/g.58531  ORF Transcript_31937/g.58531 Transcript_31937/m.58531 type:complete len:228 (+) Transcript_31937:85-768(+)